MRSIKTALAVAGLAVVFAALPGIATAAVTSLSMEAGEPVEPVRAVASTYPSAVWGERLDQGELQGNVTVLANSHGKVSCAYGSFDGGKLSGPSTSLTFNATYSGCKIGSAATTVSMNSCRYVDSNFKDATDYYTTSTEIDCNPGDSITITATGCTITIPEQAITGGTQLSNWTFPEQKPSVLSYTFGSQLKYTATAGCALLGFAKGGSYEDGTNELDVELHGFTMTGKAAPTQPVLTAGTYPSTVSGERINRGELQGSITVLANNVGKVSCTGGSFSSGYIYKPATAATFNATYSGCKIGSAATTVSMNSCRYVNTEFNDAANYYTAAAAIDCNPGDSITITATGCTITIPEQAINGGTQLTNRTFPGEKPSVLSSTVGSELAYTASPGCALLGFAKGGSYENGTNQLDVELRAST